MSSDTTDATGSPANAGEKRGARRSSLMLRAAKLLGESGEYVCVVRDVSATGTRLRLFHAPPPESHLFIELASGERHAMERVWHRDDHAGFRFSCSIDVARFIREPSAFARRPIRIRLQRHAALLAGGGEREAILVDLSQHGACIEADGKLAVGQVVRLNVDGLPPREGRVRWRHGERHGLVFQQGYRLDELALHAFALQPFALDPAPEPEALPLRVARYG